MEYSCASRSVQMVKFLLDLGVDPNTQDEVHWYYYSLQQYFNACPLLQDGWTPLMAASTRDFPDIVQELLNGGANPDIRDKV